MSSKKKSVISKASPHTIKKFELIEEYIKSWAEKLLLTDSCNGLIFIDCMCNSGVYINDAGQVVKGTAVRVSEVLWKVARTYTDNNIHIYLFYVIKQYKIFHKMNVILKLSHLVAMHTSYF